jgi:hypothetical protein
METTIVCLAASRKHRGYCYAGREWSAPGVKGRWVRPISPDDGHGVALDDCSYECGTQAALLDVIRIQLEAAEPVGFQKENFIIDKSYYWQKLERLCARDVRFLAEDLVKPLWKNEFSSRGGLNDRVPCDVAANFLHSLRLVRPQRPLFRVEKNLYNGKMEVRVEFQLGDHQYRLKVTDPQYETMLRQRGAGSYKGSKDMVFCVSLSEPFGDFAYKLVAGVLSPHLDHRPQ